jgi:Cu(I)/Ag(I) efflux system protein CusF
MKQSALALALSLAAAGTALAAEMPGHNMEGMKMTAPTAAQVNQSIGVVKAIDAAKGLVTLAHEPVPALQWPAMTMPFTISPELAKGIQVGQRVNFEFTAKGMNGTVTKISVAK